MIRQRRCCAMPILETLEGFLGQRQSEVLAKSPIGKAVPYTINHRPTTLIIGPALKPLNL